jgi:hypothetical protein
MKRFIVDFITLLIFLPVAILGVVLIGFWGIIIGIGAITVALVNRTPTNAIKCDCAWCQAEVGKKVEDGLSTHICERHKDEMLRQTRAHFAGSN